MIRWTVMPQPESPSWRKRAARPRQVACRYCRQVAVESGLSVQQTREMCSAGREWPDSR